MSKKFFPIKFLFFSCLFFFYINQAFSNGSYLFCINKNVNTKYMTIEGIGWNWAKGEDKTNILEEYKNFIIVYENNGIWLSGYAVLPSYSNGYTLSLNNTFQNKKEAKKFCFSLIKKCQQDFGTEFSLLGVSSWDIPNWNWGTIAIKYGLIGWGVCDNWERLQDLNL
jgi:hypothetical protein